MKLTQQDTSEINSKVDLWNEGIFTEPNYIPVHIKEPVIYLRWISSGYRGGSCWGDEAVYFGGDPEPDFKILDLVLEKIKPNISYLEYKKIEKITHTNSETEYEYYGNSTDYNVKYIILSELYKLLEIED